MGVYYDYLLRQKCLMIMPRLMYYLIVPVFSKKLDVYRAYSTGFILKGKVEANNYFLEEDGCRV